MEKNLLRSSKEHRIFGQIWPNMWLETTKSPTNGGNRVGFWRNHCAIWYINLKTNTKLIDKIWLTYQKKHIGLQQYEAVGREWGIEHNGKQNAHPNVKSLLYLCTEKAQICSYTNCKSNCQIYKAVPLGDNKGNAVQKSTNCKDEINGSL